MTRGRLRGGIWFEKRGIPAAVIITERFVPTAIRIAERAAMPGYPHAVVPHPVGSLSAVEVCQLRRRRRCTGRSPAARN